MSFGRPGALSDTFKVSPPLRGSFPLDHDGECHTFMLSYMKCLKANKSDAGKCRLEARDYLGCRMDNDLMSREEWQNLGLGNVPETSSAKNATSAPPSSSMPSASGGSSSSSASASNTPQSSSSGSGRWVPSERI